MSDPHPSAATPEKGFGLAGVSVDRPVFAAMLICALVAVGALSYARLGVDLLPQVEMPQVTVFTALPGAGPEEIESAITQPIEEQLNTIAGIEEMRSVNREGFSFVIVTFSLDRNIDAAVQDVRDKLSRLARVLPDGTDPPVISTFDAESTPILAVALAGPQSLREMTEFAETRLKDVIGTAPGVGQVSIEGGMRRALNIIVDTQRLAALGISILDVKRAIAAQNVDIPGGRVTRGGREDILRTLARAESADALGDVVLKSPRDGVPVFLRDVARIEDTSVEQRGASRLNGQNAVTLTVQKLAGANIVDTAAGVKARVDTLRSALPAGTEMVILRDASRFVDESVHEARFHLIGGAILAALAVLFFMGSWRSTIIAATAIPTSLIATFAAMKAFDFTLNNVTLLALTLATGVVIDDAIVVVENIHRRMTEGTFDTKTTAKLATREIALAVSATTLSLVVIFLPVAFMRGQIGRLFHSYGITVSVAILVSLFVAFTLTPMMSSRLLQAGESQHPLAKRSQRLMTRLEDIYTRMVAWSLDHRGVVAGVSLLSVVAVVPLYQTARAELMPEDDQSEFEISIELPTGTAFTAADATLREIEPRVAKLPFVQSVLATVGDARGTGAATRASIYVGLVDVSARPLSQDAVMQKARALFAGYPDLRVTIKSLNTGGLSGPGYGGKLRMAVRGPDLQRLEGTLRDLLKAMRADPAFVDASSPSADRLPELRVVPDRKKAADLGVSPGDVAEALRILVGGDRVSAFRDGDERYDIWLRADANDRNSLEAIAAMPLSFGGQPAVRIENLASITEAQGATLILRLNGLRQVFVSANPAPGVALGDAKNALTRLVEQLNLPPGYDTVFMGDVKTMDETRYEFLIALALSLLFVYMVLAAQFESLLHPITILLALPLTAPFALISIHLTGESINVYSIFGMFMLFGIVKKNGILQVDTTNQLLGQGMPLREAILLANRIRLRPILMTTLTLVAAMAPMTIAQGPGAASRAALARVIVGGQALSLVTSLLIVPVAYATFEDWRRRWRAYRLGTSAT